KCLEAETDPAGPVIHRPLASVTAAAPCAPVPSPQRGPKIRFPGHIFALNQASVPPPHRALDHAYSVAPARRPGRFSGGTQPSYRPAATALRALAVSALQDARG